MSYYQKHLSEPWFSLVLYGKKTVECRINKGFWSNVRVGDVIDFYNDGVTSCYTTITRISKYPDFKTCLINEGLDKCLPNITTIEEGCDVYYEIYSKEQESQYGVICFELE